MEANQIETTRMEAGRVEADRQVITRPTTTEAGANKKRRAAIQSGSAFSRDGLQ